LGSGTSAELERIAPRFAYRRKRSGSLPGWDCYNPASFDRKPLDLAPITAGLARVGFGDAVAALLGVTESCLERARAEPAAAEVPNPNLAAALGRTAECLLKPRDRELASMHATALAEGYTHKLLGPLAGPPAELTVVAGYLESWFGKAAGRLPTAYVAVRNSALEKPIAAARQLEAEMQDRLRALHFDLKLGRLPEFVPVELAMMAGEGNRHPKHIAYFLPSDLGVSHSPHKCSHYFSNVHIALIEAAALPLARSHLDLGAPWPEAQQVELAALGVFAHEAGHCVSRTGTSLAELNRTDRWLSVMMQEVMADVFGTVLLADVIGPRLGYDVRSVIGYHLAECLRYVDRGLGCFADSDGMYLQLAYLAEFGVLTPSATDPSLLEIDADAGLAAFRSLARVLADTVLAGDVETTRALGNRYGPQSANGVLHHVLAARSDRLPATLDFRQQAPAQCNQTQQTGERQWAS
jgi:hypothetical protein